MMYAMGGKKIKQSVVADLSELSKNIWYVHDIVHEVLHGWA